MAFADRILLNKIDLVSDTELAAVMEQVRSINGVAEVIKTTNSVVDLDKVLGVSSFSIEKTLEVDPDFLEDEEGHAVATAAHDECCGRRRRLHGHGHSHDGGKTECRRGSRPRHGHGEPAAKKPRKKRHDLTGVSSVGILAEGELDFNQVNTFMMTVLQENAKSIHCSKGVLCSRTRGTPSLCSRAFTSTSTSDPRRWSGAPTSRG